MVEKNKSEGLGISGFTLGVMSIILAGWLGAITAVIGFIFCNVQQKRFKTSLGKAGRILNVIGFVFSIILLAVYTYYLFPAIGGA